MHFFKEELKNVKAFAFDVDGVLSKDTTSLNEDGDPVRTANIKDGFAIRYAINLGYPVAIITGSNTQRIQLRYERLGVKFIYHNVSDKIDSFTDFLSKTGIHPENVLFMGDDLVDYAIMLKSGIPVCPMDAVAEIKTISRYISSRNGGEGCVRDVIELVLRAQNKWFTEEMLINKAF
jgi:3-deoxy-D-manno-octulosonate 8-phosphate phosphatase (KDO 8-P phosphatase)